MASHLNRLVGRYKDVVQQLLHPIVPHAVHHEALTDRRPGDYKVMSRDEDPYEMDDVLDEDE